MQKYSKLKADSSGFTLLELIVTITVISILSYAVYVRLPTQSTFELNTAITALKYDIRLTQVLATSLNRRYRIVISANSYDIQDESSVPYFNPSANSTTTTLPSGLELSGSPGTLIFDGLGVPYNGSVELTSASEYNIKTIGSTCPSSTCRSIRVEPRTGFAHE